jgi:hypothetical protein
MGWAEVCPRGDCIRPVGGCKYHRGKEFFSGAGKSGRIFKLFRSCIWKSACILGSPFIEKSPEKQNQYELFAYRYSIG